MAHRTLQRDRRFNWALAAKRFRRGETASDIAQSAGVSRQAVTRALGLLGVDAGTGGVALQRRVRAAEAAATTFRRDRVKARYVGVTYGMTLPAYMALRSTRAGQLALKCYAVQRRNKIAGGATWRLSFAQWWRVWERSGVWSRRARGGFGLARIHGDRPFEVGNVAIVYQPFRFRGGVVPRSAQVRAGRCPDAGL